MDEVRHAQLLLIRALPTENATRRLMAASQASRHSGRATRALARTASGPSSSAAAGLVTLAPAPAAPGPSSLASSAIAGPSDPLDAPATKRDIIRLEQRLEDLLNTEFAKQVRHSLSVFCCYF